MLASLCDNCNGDNGGGQLSHVRVSCVLGKDKDWTSDAGSLCTACINALRSLDFALLVRRHEARARSMELP